MNYIIVVDWGTSHLRAYLCKVMTDGQFEHVDSAYALGVSKCEPNFQQELMHCIQPWAEQFGKLAIYLAGQIGSSIGWKEAPYLPCPVAPGKIAQSCLEFNCQGHKISVIPGVSCQLDDNNYDVMRGEEIQVLGWLQLHKSHSVGRHLLCLPGTHTKWVLIENGEIQLFKTAMTGELYDLLSNQSVLIQQPTSNFDCAAFAKGAKYTLESELGNFSHGIFSVRSKQLFGELSPEQASSYLSGLLIGSDVRAAINAHQWQLNATTKVTIIGDAHLSQCFADVLTMQNISSEICEVSKTTLLGFSSVYQAKKV